MLRLNRIIVAVSLLVIGGGLVSTLSPGKVSALSGSDFNPGNIISNQTFTNSGSMSVADIQNFLNYQVSCDTRGSTAKTYYVNQSTGEIHTYNFSGATQVNGNYASYGQAYASYWNNHTTDSQGDTRSSTYVPNESVAPYVCLPNYVENPSTLQNNLQNPNATISGGQSAAQIIYNAAQAYQINPQVLLVTLQKEQGLVTDTWPWMNEYETAMGYACPDTAPCNSQYYGFANQVNNAAAQFHRYMINPNNYNYVVGTNTILYNPNSGCGSSQVNIVNQATASLYDYTPYQPNAAALANVSSTSSGGTGDSCSAYGNRNFWWYFNVWFGSPTAPVPTQCNSTVTNTVCVWSLRKSDGAQLLTSSQTELHNAMYQYGWTNEGIVFYASSVQGTGMTPVYRVQKGDVYYFTTNQATYTSMVSTQGWTDEGTAFYALPATTSNASYQVYELYNSTTGKYYWATGGAQESYMLQSGYQLDSNTFNSFSRFVSPPTPAAGRANIYRLQNSAGYFYTTSLSEVDATINAGCSYQGVLTTANASNAGTPIYRLRYGNRYFFTANSSERDTAVNNYGYTYEEIGFYVDGSSDTVYRLANTQSGAYLYTSNIYEVMSAVNTNGWVYQGMLISSSSTLSPVYRFLNVYNNRHFYTIDINEATQITNKNWRFETIAFSASTSSGSPVYRLRLGDKYLYTADPNERDVAVSKYGYTYEEIAFYASTSTTTIPVYRLQGGNNEYFYTASSAERDSAVSKYGYTYEGIGFYLPSS